MSSRLSRELTTEQHQIFANVLRDCLGLGPLYHDDSPNATEQPKRKRKPKPEQQQQAEGDSDHE